MSAKVDQIVSINPLREEPYLTSRRLATGTESAGAVRPRGSTASRTSGWNSETFAREQVRGLIQRVFFPGWPKSSHQALVSSVDAEVDSARTCERVVREMAMSLPGTVCAVEGDADSPTLALRLAESLAHPANAERNGAVSIARNLWLIEPDSLFSQREDGLRSVSIRTRLSELRRSFDYSLIHAPAASFPETVLLGQMADGVMLVVQQRRTHRAVAQRTIEVLKSAKVAVLGTILTERTFPIPEKLYRRL